MLHRGVARNKVEQNVHLPLVCFVEEAAEILIGSIARSNRVVVCYIISCIAKRGQEEGVDPQRIAAKFTDVIQLFNNALEVADAIGIRVFEGLGIYLVEDCVVKSLRLLACHGYFPLYFICQLVSPAPLLYNTKKTRCLHLETRYYFIKSVSMTFCRVTRMKVFRPQMPC